MHTPSHVSAATTPFTQRRACACSRPPPQRPALLSGAAPLVGDKLHASQSRTALRRRATSVVGDKLHASQSHTALRRRATSAARARRHEGTLCFHRPRRLLRASAWAEGCGRYRSRSCGTKKSARPDDLLNHTRGLIITILALVVHSSTPLPLLGPCTSPPQTLNASALIALVLYPHESLSMRAR